MNEQENIQVVELVNPARCMVCGKSAKWWVTVGEDSYESYYYCDDCKFDNWVDAIRDALDQAWKLTQAN